MDTATAATKLPKRKPPVRRDPERRRQQNMEAQKRYRDLEAIAASVSPSHVDAVVGEANDAPSPRPPGAKTATNYASGVERGSSCGTSSHVVAEEHFPGPDESRVRAVVREAKESSWTVISKPNETPLSPDSWDSVMYLDPCLLVGHSPEYSDTGLAWMPASGCGCSNADDGLQRIVKHRGGARSFGLLEPYANHLRLETVCTLDAMFSLGTLLGIPSERMCPPETQSPFFRPGLDELSGVHAISTVQKIFRTLKPDLRPGCEQVTVAHHPFIDCLPFPTLRRNLLVHRAHIDAEQLQFDVIEGLVCWGGAGISKRDSKDSTGCASTGTPWDVRSWEAKECFLRKYWTLLGGEDGELVRQSEWWRGIRGEEPLRIELMS
ncbi:hypothetical protein PG984_009562 [Apiospora sp. TS-2023a]